MIRFETEQSIDRPPADVWTYAADIRRHPEWMGVADARIVQGQGTEVGARALERIKVGPRSVDVEFEVSASIPERRIAWTVLPGSPLAGEVALDLEPIDAHATRAVWSGWLGLSGLWRVMEPLMAAEIRSGEARELRRLKDNLERSEAMAAAD